MGKQILTREYKFRSGLFYSILNKITGNIGKMFGDKFWSILVIFFGQHF